MIPGNIDVSELRGDISTEAQEAAVRYANGNPTEAADIIARAIAEPRPGEDSRPLWLMLFDLYRLQARWGDFDDLSRRYAATFGKSAPQWIVNAALPDSLPENLRRGGAGYCEIAGELGKTSADQLEGLRRAAADQSVVHLNLARVESVTAEGCELLGQHLQFLIANGNGVFFSGGEHFEKLLRAAVDATPRIAPYWRLMLDLHRLQGRQKQFESTALEYALAVETDPPRWDPILMPVLPQSPPAERREEPRYGSGPEVIYFRGEMSGTDDPQLGTLRQFAQGRKYVNVNLAQLTRMDMMSATSLGNTVLALTNLGKVVRIIKPNLLVGTLLRMLRIDEHASIVDPAS